MRQWLIQWREQYGFPYRYKSKRKIYQAENIVEALKQYYQERKIFPNCIWDILK